MKKRKGFGTVKLPYATVVLLLAGMHCAQAQVNTTAKHASNQANAVSKIPEALVAKTQYKVNKTVNPRFSLDDNTPFLCN